MTCRMNSPMARIGFLDPLPCASAPVAGDGAFWLEFTLGCPISSRSSASDRMTPAGSAGQTGLEPATCGFGDRCATNCATALHEDRASCGRPREPSEGIGDSDQRPAYKPRGLRANRQGADHDAAHIQSPPPTCPPRPGAATPQGGTSWRCAACSATMDG